MGIDQDRKYGRQIVVLAVVFADRHPLARRGLGLLYIGRHRLPFARILRKDDVPFGVHVETPLAMHAIGLFDALVAFRRSQQSHHLGTAEDKGFSIAPTLHFSVLARVGSVRLQRAYFFLRGLRRAKSFAMSSKVVNLTPGWRLMWLNNRSSINSTCGRPDTSG